MKIQSVKNKNKKIISTIAETHRSFTNEEDDISLVELLQKSHMIEPQNPEQVVTTLQLLLETKPPPEEY